MIYTYSVIIYEFLKHTFFFTFRIKEDHSLECLQLLNNEKKLFVQERDKVKEEVI